TVILKNCGIRKMKFHILRHTFATKWVNSNFDVKSLSEILGHSTVNITLSLYVHPSIEDKRKIMDKMCVA
ncbi:MAG: tyrosine-type recombinase/integrase, partial [Firmicutes bacterium]|nr:tyrosine-type recombinase/integrase [Bacillota bacterium]